MCGLYKVQIPLIAFTALTIFIYFNGVSSELSPQKTADIDDGKEIIERKRFYSWEEGKRLNLQKLVDHEEEEMLNKVLNARRHFKLKRSLRQFINNVNNNNYDSSVYDQLLHPTFYTF